MSTLDTLRSALTAAVAELPDTDVADVIGMLAAVQARLLARLTVPAPAVVTDNELVTAGQVAQAFGVPVSQIYEQARQRRIPCVRLGKYVRFSIAEVQRALGQAQSSEYRGA